MCEDIKHKGNKYRIFSEEINLRHPCEAIVKVFQLKEQTGHTEVWSETASTDSELERMARDALVFVRNL